MGRKSTFAVNESTEELEALLSQKPLYKSKIRLKALLCIKENRFNTRRELADYLEIHLRTLERWLVRYHKEGIEELIKKERRNKKSSFISDQIHDCLSRKLNSSDDAPLGYWEIHQWIKEEFNIDIKYHTLRHYLIRHFKTKLKSARKSHAKKDMQAEEAFLKTT